MRAVASLGVMFRSCALALLAFALPATPAVASDATVTFQCCQYTPDNVRVLPGEQLTIEPAAGSGVAFDNHPLHYADNVGNTLTGTTPAARTFPRTASISGTAGSTATSTARTSAGCPVTSR
jgi:hypothetical protein